jgi:Mrp family chromosome partitioning ATPase
VRKIPDVYTSRARISTGLVQQTSGQQVLSASSYFQEGKINQLFDNYIEQMRLKKIINQVSYQLMIHDLTSKEPFQRSSNAFKNLSSSEKEHAVAVYTQMYQNHEALSLEDKDQQTLYQLLVSMKYDDQSLNKNLKIARAYSSDFIDVTCESPNPFLSAFIANSLCAEFLSYYSGAIKNDQSKTVDFLAQLMHAKRDSLNIKLNALKEYKTNQHVLNLYQQATALYGQIRDLELRKQEEVSTIDANQGVLRGINNKFSDKDQGYLEGSISRINQDLVNTREQLKVLNEEYIKNNYDSKYSTKIDSLKKLLSIQINASTDKNLVSPLATKQDLVTQKLNAEIKMDLAKNSIKSIDAELSRLNTKFNTLVPHEAVIQGYENGIDIDGKEYMELLNKYNQANIESNISGKLSQSEQAEPGTIVPSKKMFLVVLSGVASLVLCLFVLFVAFYFNNSVETPRELANNTNKTVLGCLPFVKAQSIDLTNLWNDAAETKNLKQMKNMLRSIRFEINKEMSGAKLLAVSSLADNEGKTFFSINLAYAYAMVNKKVLLIDGTFDKGEVSITQILKPSTFIENYLNSDGSFQNISSAGAITVLGNKGGEASLFELSSEENVKQKLRSLSNNFDMVIVDVPSLKALNRSKEWIESADKIITVFQSNQSINQHKQQLVQDLTRTGNKWMGWIMNKMALKQIQA